MSPMRTHRPWFDGVLATTVVLAATTPLWRMAWLRDDWLLLWRALDPASAPAGAAGVFPRPVASLLWNAAVALSGDAPWGMHLLIILAWFALVLGALRWHRHFGGGSAGAALAALAVVLHGALVEPRLWAAAGNGVLAGALGVWGAWRLWSGPGRVGRAFGVVLMLLAALARADAVVLLVLPIVAGARAGRATGRLLTGLAVLGAVALGAMVVFGGGWAFRPADGGHLLRLLVVPWGPPLPTGLAAAAGLLGAFLCLAGGRLLLVAAPRIAAFLLAGGAVAVAGSLVDWTAAGRYVLMPAVPLALALGAWWEGAARTEGPRLLRRGLRGLLLAWLAASAAAIVAGRTAGDLQARSAAETGLYRALRAEPLLPDEHLTVLNPPSVGWTGGAADFENIASTAMRRPVTVTLGRGESHTVAFPTAVWRHGAWIIWTGREPRPTGPESR